jgi:hypothetical protein
VNRGGSGGLFGPTGFVCLRDAPTRIGVLAARRSKATTGCTDELRDALDGGLSL